jgi:hypothetical protein
LLQTRDKHFEEDTGKIRLDHGTNQDIRQQCSIQPIGKWISKRQDEWDNHIPKITEDIIVRAVSGNIPKARSPGGSKKHWFDSFSSRNCDYI